jgi:hypothetical protein
MVTVSNGFLQLFSLDKNYFEYALTSEQLKTEGWQFFQLSGKYEDYEDHKEAYRPFCKSIENIKRKQVEKEFSGKGGTKKKEFNFQKELKQALPDQYEPKGAEFTDKTIMSLLSKMTAVTEPDPDPVVEPEPESVTEPVKKAPEQPIKVTDKELPASTP